MRVPDRQDLVVRMGCCAASDWFAEEEKGRVEIRSISLRGVVTHSRSTEEMGRASAATAAASIAEVRAWATLDDTGLARSLAMVRRLNLSAEDATSTKEGATCLLPLMIMTSEPLPRSSEELELPSP